MNKQQRALKKAQHELKRKQRRKELRVEKFYRKVQGKKFMEMIKEHRMAGRTDPLILKDENGNQMGEVAFEKPEDAPNVPPVEIKVDRKGRIRQ